MYRIPFTLTTTLFTVMLYQTHETFLWYKITRIRSYEPELQRQHCKNIQLYIQVAYCVLKTKIVSSTLKKLSSLLQRWRCRCKFQSRRIGSGCTLWRGVKVKTGGAIDTTLLPNIKMPHLSCSWKLGVSRMLKTAKSESKCGIGQYLTCT
jgi:hypothetical protein